MIRLIQRVSETAVRVDDHVVSEIGPGLLALVCAERRDAVAEVDRLLEKLLNYRVFSDAQGKMNLPVRNTDSNRQTGGLLAVSQFTLATDTGSGTRPSSAPATALEGGHRPYEHLVARARVQHPIMAAGEFDADMKVPLVNDDPVTLWLQIVPQAITSVAKTAAPETVKSV